MDRIDRIGPQPPQWVRPELDPDRDDIADRRRRDEERRRRERREQHAPPPPPGDDEPPHLIDLQA